MQNGGEQQIFLIATPTSINYENLQKVSLAIRNK